MKDPRTSLWVARNGSIYTVETEIVLSPFTKKPIDERQPHAVAFNVGAIAEHIVALHNEWHATKGPGFVQTHNEWAERVGSANWER